MFGLIVILIMAAYLLLSIAVVKGARRYARKNGKSVARWGWGAALVMYLIPFWDWLPTVATHQYYCASEAGFWVYKTPEQWNKENPGVMETLVENKDTPSQRIGDKENFTKTYFLNQRINALVKKTGPLVLNRWRWEQYIEDTKTGEILARYVDFSTGNGNIGGEIPLRFWVQIDGCTGGSALNSSQFKNFEEHFQGKSK